MDMPSGRRRRMIAWKNGYDRKVRELRESDKKSSSISFTFDDMMEIYGPQIAKIEEER